MVVILTGLLLSGCAKKQLAEPGNPLCVNSVEKEAMVSAEKLLTGMHFEIEKYDVGNGYIKTRPLRGAQFFEFWRKDNASAADAEMANLHSIQRQVELSFEKGDAGLCITCIATVSRLSMPEKQITGISQEAGL